MNDRRHDRPVPAPRFETIPARQHHLFGLPGHSVVYDRWYRIVVRVDGRPPAALPDAEATALAARLETDYRQAVTAGRLAADGTPPEGGCDEFMLEDQVVARLHALGWDTLLKGDWPVDATLACVAGRIADRFAAERYDLLGDAPTQTLADVPDSEFDRAARDVLDHEGALPPKQWNHLRVTYNDADRRLEPVIGPGGLTQAQAHAEVLGQLDRAGHAELAELWRDGTKDRTVTADRGRQLWTIYDHPAGQHPHRAALIWLADYAERFRADDGR